MGHLFTISHHTPTNPSRTRSQHHLIADRPSYLNDLRTVLRNTHGREMGCSLSDGKAERDASPALAHDHQCSLQLLGQRKDQAEAERPSMVDIEVRTDSDPCIADGQGHLSHRFLLQRDRHGPRLVRGKGMLQAIREYFMDEQPAGNVRVDIYRYSLGL
jgi:hypothetical protein